MATTHPQPNIWAQMSYTPPRGACAQKLSMLTTCPCHRFMIHPLKAATSFECDGCGHHASFHRMANEGEEAVVRGWREEEMQKGRVEGGKGGTGGYGIENEVVEEERRKKIEAGHRRAYEGLVEEMTKRREGGHEVRDGMRAKKGRRRMIEGPAPGAWEAGEDEEDEDVVEEVDKNVVDKEFIMELKRIREADAAEENRQREEEKKELERGRAMEAETSGRGRKRKGR